jgi:CheY-like chemotaxis protein
LISDLLDMSRIVSGKLRMESQRVEFEPVLEAAIEAVRPMAEAKGVRLECCGPGAKASGVAVMGDPARLQQVVWNLLTNAVKFTQGGGCVSVELSRKDSSAVLVIRDTGMGMKPEFLPHVFERFRQADSSTARTHGGLGLGLAIVKQLTELHGGSVAVASEGEGKGSAFTVTVPLAGELSAGVGTVAASSSETAPDLCGVRVLVVDDDADARELARRVLEDSGALVTAAAGVDEALEAVRKGGLDVIISDIGLPGRDGYEFISRLREQGCRVPVAALTAYARPEDRSRALRAGFRLYLVKPLESSALVQAVASLVQVPGSGK